MPDPERRTGESRDSREIIVVSGLPRSGTSMMMKMLQAGGVPLLTDGLRVANRTTRRAITSSNGSRSCQPAIHAWLEEAPGHGVKIISALLEHLPAGYRYQVIFVERSIGRFWPLSRRCSAERGVRPIRLTMPGWRRSLRSTFRW